MPSFYNSVKAAATISVLISCLAATATMPVTATSNVRRSDDTSFVTITITLLLLMSSSSCVADKTACSGNIFSRYLRIVPPQRVSIEACMWSMA